MMPKYQPLSIFWYLLSIIPLLFTLSACGLLEGGDDENIDNESEQNIDIPELKLVAAKRLPMLPWFFAAENNIYDNYIDDYKVKVNFEASDDYESSINQFLSEKADAIIVSNIDAISKIMVKNDLQVDVILITAYSQGDNQVLIDSQHQGDLSDQTVALTKYSTEHYLLDRYLLRNQIDFNSVEVLDTSEVELADALGRESVAGVVASNPIADSMIVEQQAKVLFSTLDIPKEIFYMLIVHRSKLEEHPNFARALLATWFSVMENMQGNSRNATMDALAIFQGVDSDAMARFFDGLTWTETATKALSVIRDRSMRKTMRHIRFFMKRHELAEDIDVANWVSYPGRTPSTLHFNAKPLQTFIAPPEADDS